MRLPLMFFLFLGLASPAFAHGSPRVLLSLGGTSLFLVVGVVALVVLRAARADKVKAALLLATGISCAIGLTSISDYEQNHLLIDAALLSVSLLCASMSIWIQLRRGH
jgi:hypothetical protein